MDYIKLEIFIPETHFRALQKALQSVDAGHIGKYDSCLSYSRVIGTWRPLEGTNPYIGKTNEISEEPELKVEVTIKAENLQKTISAKNSRWDPIGTPTRFNKRSHDTECFFR